MKTLPGWKGVNPSNPDILGRIPPLFAAQRGLEGMVKCYSGGKRSALIR